VLRWIAMRLIQPGTNAAPKARRGAWEPRWDHVWRLVARSCGEANECSQSP
jgi:hypothetical protein